MGTSRAARPSSALCALTLSFAWLAGVAALNGARAQNVINSDFSLPSAASAPNKYIEDPPTSAQIGWTFSKVGGVTSGVQANGSAFGAPAAPDGLPQTAFIDDLNTISQNIDFKLPGDYELSFQIVEFAHGTPAGSVQSVVAYIGGEKKGTYTPKSTTSFNKITIPFTIAKADPAVELKFAGCGAGSGCTLQTGEATAVLIAQVKITPVAPQITKGPTDIDPTSKIDLTGDHFGPDKGTIRVHFPSESKVAFQNKSPHGKSKSDLYLDVPGKWGGTITSEALDSASPVGDAAEQTVEITVIASNGQSSSAWKAKFHNTVVITGVSPNSVTPGQTFNVKGWDFGGDTGKVTIHFTNNLFKSPSLDSKGDKDAQIGKGKWTPAVVNATVPKDITAVIEQDVEISLTPKGGKASNALKEKFNPTMEMGLATVVVAQCNSGTSLDLCNPAPGSYSGGGVCLGIDAAGIAPFGSNIWGFHESCAWFATDTGTDIYNAIVAPPWWTITKVDHSWEGVPPGVWEDDGNGATIEYDVNPSPPGPVVSVTVNWNISPGGISDYAFNVWMKGPAGVPH